MIGARKARKRLLVSENPGISGGELIQAMDEFFHADFTHIGAGNRGYSVTTVSYTHLDVYKRQEKYEKNLKARSKKIC